MRTFRIVVVAAFLVGGCGRLFYESSDSQSDAGLSASASDSGTRDLLLPDDEGDDSELAEGGASEQGGSGGSSAGAGANADSAGGAGAVGELDTAGAQAGGVSAIGGSGSGGVSAIGGAGDAGSGAGSPAGSGGAAVGGAGIGGAGDAGSGSDAGSAAVGDAGSAAVGDAGSAAVGDAGSGGATPAAACVVVSATYPTLQSALDDPACETISLLAGTLIESVTIARAVTIEGEAETTTVLSGGNTARVITVAPNVDVVLRDLSVTEGFAAQGAGIYSEGQLVLEGVTVSNNQGAGAQIQGAGIYQSGGTLTLLDSSVLTNVLNVNDDAAAAGYGGGLYATSSATVDLAGVIFDSNDVVGTGVATAPIVAGGAIALDGASILTASGEGVQISNNLVQSAPAASAANQSARGGGIYCTESSAVHLDSGNDRLLGNIARTEPTISQPGAAQGGAMFSQGCQIVASGAIILGNQAQCAASVDAPCEASGGAIHAEATVLSLADSLLGSNIVSAIEQDPAAFSDVSSRGGGIYASEGSAVSITTSTVRGNALVARSGSGSAAAFGGALFLLGASTPTTALIYRSSVEGGNYAEASTESALATVFVEGGAVSIQAETGRAVLDLVSSTVVDSRLVLSGPTGVLFEIRGSAIDAHVRGGGSIALGLYNTTVSDNKTLSGSGDALPLAQAAALSSRLTGAGTNDTTLQDSIVANTDGIDDCSTEGVTISFAGANIVEQPTCDYVGVMPITSDPLLGSLGDSGGPTETLLPGAGSAAREGAAICQDRAGDALVLDQRGLARVGQCDLGAVEAQPGE